MATTTLPVSLADRLHSALEGTGHGEHATEIVGLLPDRGRYNLLEALTAGGLNLLLARWVEELGEILGCFTADAAHIRDLLTGAAR